MTGSAKMSARPEPHAFSISMVRAGDQLLRVGRHVGAESGPPLLLFNGIGGNLELVEPFVRRLRRETIVFDVPGVGHSPMPRRPYRVRTIARLGAEVLDHFGHRQFDVMGGSWGGAPAQEVARRFPERCRRVVLCATATGTIMIPARPSVLLKLATPRRYLSGDYLMRVAGDIYGGDFRRDRTLAAQIHRHVRWQSWLGYYLQLAATAGWTSIHWLHRLSQPTLVMAGEDDPIVPLANARLMQRLIRHSTLRIFDCGHLFLLTRANDAAQTIDQFLNGE